MSIYVREFNPSDWPFIRKYATPIPCYDTCGVVCFDPITGHFLAAMLFDQLSDTSASVHICIPHMRAIKHGFLEIAFQYAFEKLKRVVLYGVVPASNSKAVNFAKRCGGTELIRLKDGFSIGVDNVLLEMRLVDCRFYQNFKEAA